MQIESLRRFFMAGFLLFVLLPAYSQNRLVSFEKELQALETYKNTLGVSSIEYADQLANMAIVFRDTTFHDYYNQLSKIIVADHWTVRDHFGIDSEVYRAILVYLSHAYTLGRLFKSVDLDYKPLVRQLILSLEDKINDVEYNKHEFYSLISNIYEADKDYKNVIKWRKRSIEKIGKTNSIDEYFYDNEFLAGAYYHTKQTKLFQKTASLLFADEDIRDEQKQMAFSFLLGQITLSNGEDWDEESARFLLHQYQGLNGIDIDKDRLIYYIPAKNGDLRFLKLIEEVCLSKGDMSLQQQFYYYYYVSMFLSQDAKDQKSSIEYCHKAMAVMERIGTCESRFRENGRPYYEMLAFRYEEDKNYLKATEYYAKGLEDIENCQGDDNDNYISLAEKIGTIFSIYLADNTKSLLYKNKALSSIKRIYGIQSKEYCELAISLIADMRFLNRFDEAKTLCDSMITVLSRSQVHKDYLASLYNQRGLIATNLKEIREAVASFEKAVNLSSSINDSIVYLSNREQALRDMGFDTEGELSFIDSLISCHPEVKENTRFSFYHSTAIAFSAKDNNIAKHYYDLADRYSGNLLPHRKAYFRLSQFLSEPSSSKRYSLLLDAIDIYDKHQLKDSMLLAEIYSKMAYYYSDVYNHKESLNYYEKAIDLYTRINVDATDEGFLTCLNNYAIQLSHIKESNESACHMLDFVYNTRKSFLSFTSPVLKSTLSNLIICHLEGGRVEQADSLFKKDRTILLGITKFDIYSMDLLYAKIQFRKGDVLEAIKNLKAIEEDIVKVPQLIIPYYETLLEYERSINYDLFDSWEKLLNIYKDDTVSELLYLSNNERKNLPKDFEFTMNKLLMDGGNDPRYYPLIADYSLFTKGLLLTTNQLIQKKLRKDKVAQQLFSECKRKRIKRESLNPSDSIQILNLDREINLIDKQLADRVSAKDLLKPLSFSSSDLQKSFGNKKMAIDFIMMATDSLSRYYAVIYKKDNIQLLPLFSKAEIAKYEKMGESGINALSKPLFGKLIWGKLLPHIKNCDELYFSPVGVLNNFAIELLPILADSVPNLSVHRVLRLEKEMFSKSQKISTQEIVAFGNIDYDKANTEETTRGQSSRKWGQLYATEAELKNIQMAYPKSHLGFYEKADASEGNFKNLDNKKINIMHLATHGFYLSDFDILAPPKTKYYPNLVSASGGQGRGGLLLCGANHSWYHAVPDSIEDGILTTEEIEELSFENLELVVQSACETGLGESNTDGVWGLQRAFRIAGANRQVVSLLRVDDERTKEFMDELHKNISKSKEVYGAYKMAQRYMYNKYKSNPRFWASFILLE